MAVKKKIIALDIGSYAAKVAVTSIGTDGADISRLESFRIPAGQQSPLESLRPWMEKNGFVNCRTVIALDGKDVIFQPLQMVPSDPRTPEQAAAMEVIKFNEMASEAMIFDYSEFSLAEKDKRLLLSIARPSLLDTPLALAGARGLQIEDIIPSPIALFNGLAPKHGSEEHLTLYVHAGHSSTSLSIGHGEQLIFARAFSCAGSLFTNAIAESAGIPLSQAENAKHASGSLNEGTTYAEVLKPAAERWFAELNSCLSIFKSLFPSDKSTIKEAVFTGGTAQLEGLAEYLAKQLNIKVTAPSTEEPGDAAPEFAVCKGLAYSLMETASAKISLLPDNVREDIASRRQRPFWFAAAAAAVITLLISLAGGYIQLKRTQGILNNRQADMSARRQLASKIESVRMKNERIQHMATPLTRLLNATPVMTSILRTVAENRGADEWITVVCDSESYFNERLFEEGRDPNEKKRFRSSREEKDDKQQAGMSSVIIEGFTRNSSLSTVSTLITKLQELEFIESADLLSDDRLAKLPKENMETQLNAIRFAVEVKVKE